MSCKNCSSPRILSISGKCSDMCFAEQRNINLERNDYAPCGVGIGGGDYIEFSYCLECGQIQDSFPVPDLQKEDV